MTTPTLNDAIFGKFQVSSDARRIRDLERALAWALIVVRSVPKKGLSGPDREKLASAEGLLG